MTDKLVSLSVVQRILLEDVMPADPAFARIVGGTLQAAVREIATLPAAQPALDLERAFQILEANGVPRERARTVANGIEVLVTRLSREIHALRAAQGEPSDAARIHRWATTVEDEDVSSLGEPERSYARGWNQGYAAARRWVAEVGFSAAPPADARLEEALALLREVDKVGFTGPIAERIRALLAKEGT